MFELVDNVPQNAVIKVVGVGGVAVLVLGEDLHRPVREELIEVDDLVDARGREVRVRRREAGVHVGLWGDGRRRTRVVVV